MTENAPKKILTPNNLSNEECRKILMEMDREAKNFWQEQKDDLIGALEDNLRDFGDFETEKFVIKPSLD